MYKVRIKTEEEISEGGTFTEIKCKDCSSYRYERYWYCESCQSVFEPEDTVLLRTQGENQTLVCPLLKNKKDYFGKISFSTFPCKKDLTFGEKKYFEDNYKRL